MYGLLRLANAGGVAGGGLLCCLPASPLHTLLQMPSTTLLSTPTLESRFSAPCCCRRVHWRAARAGAAQHDGQGGALLCREAAVGVHVATSSAAAPDQSHLAVPTAPPGTSTPHPSRNHPCLPSPRSTTSRTPAPPHTPGSPRRWPSRSLAGRQPRTRAPTCACAPTASSPSPTACAWPPLAAPLPGALPASR